jgi:hypothetical protein
MAQEWSFFIFFGASGRLFWKVTLVANFFLVQLVRHLGFSHLSWNVALVAKYS